ncbi:MAG: RluA family pseudouridine synthase [Proteobacteria bacterium]|nr:RluA family pseudouridine synthase [Pseudomonadota bacterium]
MALIPSNRIFHHVTAKPARLKQVLMEHFKLSDERASDLIKLGAIYSNKKRIFENRELPQGTYLRLHLHPKRFFIEGIDWKSRLLKETTDFIVINKPAGVPTHATVDNAIENSLAQMRKVLGCELLVTQRLDTPVGGVLLFAKNKDYQAKFNRMLSERSLQKTYLALVEKPCPLGRHLHWMQPSERSPKVLSAESRTGWLSCELSVLSCVPKDFGEKSFFQVEVDLHTGRTHQIRAQLAFMGCPIVGDKLYGAAYKFHPNCIALMAKRLKWPPANLVELKDLLD